MSIIIALIGGALIGLLLLVGSGVFLWARFRNASSEKKEDATTEAVATTAATDVTPKLSLKQLLVAFGLVVGAWLVGSVVTLTLESPGPYFIALVVGAWQFYRGRKKGNFRNAILVTLLIMCLVWVWIHPYALASIVEWFIGPLGSLDALKHWDGSKVSSALNILMVVIVVWHLWVSGDFYGMLLILLVIIVLRAGFGV